MVGSKIISCLKMLKKVRMNLLLSILFNFWLLCAVMKWQGQLGNLFDGRKDKIGDNFEFGLLFEALNGQGQNCNFTGEKKGKKRDMTGNIWRFIVGCRKYKFLVWGWRFWKFKKEGQNGKFKNLGIWGMNDRVRKLKRGVKFLANDLGIIFQKIFFEPDLLLGVKVPANILVSYFCRFFSISRFWWLMCFTRLLYMFGGRILLETKCSMLMILMVISLAKNLKFVAVIDKRVKMVSVFQVAVGINGFFGVAAAGSYIVKIILAGRNVFFWFKSSKFDAVLGKFLKLGSEYFYVRGFCGLHVGFVGPAAGVISSWANLEKVHKFAAFIGKITRKGTKFGANLVKYDAI